MTTLVVVLLGFLIVAGALVALVWRILWLRGTLRTTAEVLRIDDAFFRGAARDEQATLRRG
jgi:hypothetical protein